MENLNRALLAVQDGLRFAVRVSGRFLRSAFHACTVILRLAGFSSALVASHLSLKKASRA